MPRAWWVSSAPRARRATGRQPPPPGTSAGTSRISSTVARPISDADQAILHRVPNAAVSSPARAGSAPNASPTRPCAPAPGQKRPACTARSRRWTILPSRDAWPCRTISPRGRSVPGRGRAGRLPEPAPPRRRSGRGDQGSSPGCCVRDEVDSSWSRFFPPRWRRSTGLTAVDAGRIRRGRRPSCGAAQAAEPPHPSTRRSDHGSTVTRSGIRDSISTALAAPPDGAGRTVRQDTPVAGDALQRSRRGTKDGGTIEPAGDRESP